MTCDGDAGKSARVLETGVAVASQKKTTAECLLPGNVDECSHPP